MWAPYLKVIAKKAPQALNILDRFHIMLKFKEAIDDIHRGEVNQFKANGSRTRPLVAVEAAEKSFREADLSAG
jgi:transposase